MRENDVKTRPIRVFRCGAVQAAIWADHRVINDTVVKHHSIRITKNYRQDDEWKSTTTFAAEDLPKASIVAMEVYRYLRVRSFDNGTCDPDEMSETGCSGTDMQPHPL